MLTVPQAARRSGRHPETVRRWIREGKLRAQKVGTQHVIAEDDLDAVLLESGAAPLPAAWSTTFWGAPMPDWAALVQRSRSDR